MACSALSRLGHEVLALCSTVGNEGDTDAEEADGTGGVGASVSGASSGPSRTTNVNGLRMLRFALRLDSAGSDRPSPPPWSLPALAWLARRIPTLQRLEPRASSSDALLAGLAWLWAEQPGLFPELAVLDVSGASTQNLQDAGLASLADVPWPLTGASGDGVHQAAHVHGRLNVIAVGANGVSTQFASSVAMVGGRGRLGSVRRIPQFLCQRWQPTRHASIPRSERHAFTAEGTFLFSRANLNCGHIVSCTPLGRGEYYLVGEYYVLRGGRFQPPDPAAPVHAPGADRDPFHPKLCVRSPGPGRLQTVQLSLAALASDGAAAAAPQFPSLWPGPSDDVGQLARDTGFLFGDWTAVAAEEVGAAPAALQQLQLA